MTTAAGSMPIVGRALPRDAMAAWNSEDQFVWGLRALLVGMVAD
ncbi:hypothetical protein ACGFIX_06135 [Nocardia salmonicida]